MPGKLHFAKWIAQVYHHLIDLLSKAEVYEIALPTLNEH